MRILVLFLSLLTAASAQVAKPLITSELGGRELTFLRRADEQGLTMIYLAELGKSKGSTDAVRALADVLGTTESKEHDQLITLGVTKGLTFPVGTPGAVARFKTLLDPLEKAAFDKAWLGEVSSLAKASIQNFSSGAGCADAEIKKFATAGLTLAQQKLEVVEKVAKR
jgi:predicted outer membrane protein